MGQYKKYVTPPLMHLSHIFLHYPIDIMTSNLRKFAFYKYYLSINAFLITRYIPF